jgi:ferredoxin
MKTFFTLDTRNRKTGRVRLSTYRPHESCDPTCIFWNSGCYGENGAFPLFYHASKGSEDLSALIDALRSIRSGMVRFNVVGDYLDGEAEPDMAYIEATNEAKHLDVLSYTHAWRRLDPSWFHDRTRPNASCDDVADVAEALAAGWRACIVDAGVDYPQGGLIAGRRAVVCPYEVNKRQCIDCGLCARARPSVVVFPAHGTKKRAASAAIRRLEAWKSEAERVALDAAGSRLLPGVEALRA